MLLQKFNVLLVRSALNYYFSEAGILVPASVSFGCFSTKCRLVGFYIAIAIVIRANSDVR